VIDTYQVGDELDGKVTKVVTFGAFVEIMDGVEGLVHISELAHHHVENPREVVEPGQEVRVKILEIDSERRRLSLSVKRVEAQRVPLREAGGVEGASRQEAGDLDQVPELGLSEDVFAGPQIEGADDLRAAVEEGQAAQEAAAAEAEQDAEPQEAEAEQDAEPQEAEAEQDAEPQQNAESEQDAEPEQDETAS
jgi:small subunit ribosomal protein S1